MSQPVVFLDKDGTLIENVPYNVDPEQIRWAPGAEEGIQLLHDAGYHLIVITNQSGVARAYFQEEELEGVEACLRKMMARVNVPLLDFYYCPHHPEGVLPRYATVCSCRKPEPGMLDQATCDHDIDLARSWLVGDILDDIEAGRRMGCRTVMVDSGGETEWILSRGRLPHHVASDLSEAARIIAALTEVPSVALGGYL
ncbi:MAG: HAD family hydrolase [Chloroflexota bacterium]|nr:HAD family hydrolase [Chloroflexota bacterium]